MKRWKLFTTNIRSLVVQMRNRYINFLLNYPWRVIIFLSLISLTMSIYSLIAYGHTFMFNPIVGFETRGTYLSNQRLALNNLIQVAASKDDMISRSKREISSKYTYKSALSSAENDSSSEDETRQHYGYSIGGGTGKAFGACQQYFVLGSMIPYEYITLLSKIIIRVSSFNQLFTLKTMQTLCAADSIIKEVIESSTGLNVSQLKPLPYSFNLPYYTMCLNFFKPSNSCEMLNADDIAAFRSLLLECRGENPPMQCSLPIARQLESLIFQKNPGHMSLDEPFYIAAVLPVIISGDGVTNLGFYEELAERLQSHFSSEDLLLAGEQFGIKNGYFEMKIRSDARLGAIAILLVVIIILIYTQSFFFTFCIGAGLILSIGVAFFLYTAVLGIKFFPFLNLLAIILVVAVGADDAFLFMYQYRKHKREAAQKCFLLPEKMINAKESTENREAVEFRRRRVISGLTEALSHAAIAMFVTSATTAVAFLANLSSPIMVLRCFGIYAGTMMLINYIFVITILPAAIIIMDVNKELEESSQSVSFLGDYFSDIRDSAVNAVERLFAVYIPIIVRYIRIPLVLFALVTFGISLYALIKNPGIRLPEKNSMQFLRSSHPFEWFDEYATDLFDFSYGEPLKMNLIVIWGIMPTLRGSSLIPSNTGEIVVDDNFPDTLAEHLLEFQMLLKRIYYNVNRTTKSDLWLDHFIEWTQNSSSNGCSMFNPNASEEKTKQRSGDALSRCILLYGHSSPLPTFNELHLISTDGPIFDRHGTLIAYFLSARSAYNLSTIYHEMKPFFDYIGELRETVQEYSLTIFKDPLILTSRQITALYDMLEWILNGTAVSVLISLVVSKMVIIVTTFHLTLSALAILCIASVVTTTISTLLWFGWTVNVVEATIIVLTIGMSFDYCLHVAVAFKLYSINDYRSVASEVGVPVLLAAASSFVAGLALIGASTQPFFEIGVFLMLMTSISFIVAIFVFPSMVTTLLPYCTLPPCSTQTTRL